jgi:hypothetical protein
MKHMNGWVIVTSLLLGLAGSSFAGGPEVGEAAPDFELRDPEGTAYRLSSFRGRHDVVLEFIRSGSW